MSNQNRSRLSLLTEKLFHADEKDKAAIYNEMDSLDISAQEMLDLYLEVGVISSEDLESEELSGKSAAEICDHIEMVMEKLNAEQERRSTRYAAQPGAALH
ncbi:MAG: hypothetical protein AAF204_00135 [Pseudomonadota bacterium]